MGGVLSCADADAPSATVIPRIAARRKIKFWTTPSLRFPLLAGGTEWGVPLAERGEPKGGGQFVNFERAVIAPSEITTSWACRIPPLPALSPLDKGGEGRGEGGFESCAFTNFGNAVGVIPIAPSEITTSWACRIPPLPALSPLVKGGEGRGEGGFESCAFTNFGNAVGVIPIAPSEITTSWACRIPPLPALSPLVKGGEGRGEGGFESCAFTNFGNAVSIRAAPLLTSPVHGGGTSPSPRAGRVGVGAAPS
jgi:hypothetical protein